MAVSFKNNDIMYTLFCLILYLCTSFSDRVNVENSHLNKFFVKPGGQVQEFEETWGDVTCKFTYACQGGTHEEWTVEMVKNKAETEYSCLIQRPSGTSYLFFEKFELKLIGVATKEAFAVGENNKELMLSEYTHIKEESKVMWTKEFRSHLTKVEIYGTVVKHREL